MKSDEPVQIGTDRQLFLDEFWTAESDGVVRRLHSPVRREAAIRSEHPWEARLSAYHVTFHDGDRWRMYYQCAGGQPTTHGDLGLCAYAESDDGISWEKPSLGLIPFEGSTDNNLVYGGPETELAPYLDSHADVPEDQRYKATVRSSRRDRNARALYAMVSPDGLAWRRMAAQPIIAYQSLLDAHSMTFWDDELGRYVMYTRGAAGSGGAFYGGYRWIRRATSVDYLNWTFLESIDTGVPPSDHLYTNAYTPYPRAPGTSLMFPSRLVLERSPDPEWADTYFPGINDIVFMSSRDGIHFDRSFMEAWIRPGPGEENWHERGIYVGSGIVQTSAEEMSVYSRQHSRLPSAHIRRYSLRTDGFVSMSAGYSGGSFTTRPFVFSGEELELNYSTSAVGSLRVEIQDGESRPVPGFSLADGPELFGDEIEGVFRWNEGADVGRLAGATVRLRFALKDADLYAFRFRES
jgi:hypothetical protein